MDLNTFVQLYQGFLNESEKKGWVIETLIQEFGNHLTSITNMDGIEVHFFLELDMENCVQLSEKKIESKLNYGVIRQKGNGDLFANEVLEEFRQYCSTNTPKRQATFILYKVPKK
jgi:tartrate dehydratase alpha subunit/fumarate hydratase class I-like protein